MQLNISVAIFNDLKKSLKRNINAIYSANTMRILWLRVVMENIVLDCGSVNA